MKALQTITDELVADAVDTCLQDSGYMRSLIRVYFENKDEVTLREEHADAFAHLDAEEEA